MRVSSLAVFVVIAIAAVGGALWFFGGPEGFMKWKAGFGTAQTPTQAMEKFRDAIQKRKYRWAANYCTKEYAEILIKSDAQASSLGNLMDKITEFMDNKELRTDQTTLLLYHLDPFPTNFKVQGAVVEGKDNTAVGMFAWDFDSLKLKTNNPLNTNLVDPKIFTRNLVASNLFTGGVRIVKDGEQWKLSVDVVPALLEANRYFLDNAERYENELKTFRTYMMNGRYDSPKAFESELLDALRKANR
jgi:hypothetical protein